jgi:serine/threonine protein kinase/Tol biopolymer transport system component
VPTDLDEQLQAALGPGYQVAHELTGGGMSRVFVIRELELDRKLVAKVLPPELAVGVSIDRFRREIQLAAKLQHPHIVPLLSAGAREGLLYYTMPFIEGQSLRARVSRERELPVDEAVRILRDVTDALSYAHEHGVVHRDIKPDNVLLSGHHALVTDFGVSKALATATGAATLTDIGIALGTPAYMSPEQVAADPDVDHRADIYSIGVLAYELFAGRPPFVAPSPHQVLSAHMTQAPVPLRQHRPAVSIELERIVMRCLEKMPADRWQTADELQAQLETIATPRLGSTAASSIQQRSAGTNVRRSWFVAGAAVSALIITGLAWRANSGADYETGATRQVTNSALLEIHPALSPDGKLIAYAAGPRGRMRIYVRQVDGERPVALSEGAPGDHHRAPQWSADGSQIAFFSEHGVFTVPAFGGTPRPVFNEHAGFDRINLTGSLATLSPDFRTIAYVQRTGDLMVRPLAGGDARKVASGIDIHSIAWARDGARLAYVTNNGEYVYSLNALANVAPSAIWVTSLDGEPVRVTDDAHLNTSPAWTADGHLLFVSNLAGGRDVYLQRLASSGRPRGQPRRMTTGLNVHTIGLSPDGTRLVYSTFSRRSNLWTAPVGASGATSASSARPITSENQLVEGAVLSHDGKWLVYDSDRNGRQQLYRMPVAGGEPVQLTRDSTDHFAPYWSEDDRRIYFHFWREGSRDVGVINADGTGRSVLFASAGHEYYPSPSPDERQLLLRIQQRGEPPSAAYSERDSAGWSTPRVLYNAAPLARWSPDGKRFAVAHLDGTVRVASLDDSTGTILLRGAATAGSNAQYLAWSRDGRAVFYSSSSEQGDISYWSVPATGGTPRLVLAFPRDAAARPGRTEFDTDGRNLYFAVAQDESDVWLVDLRRR